MTRGSSTSAAPSVVVTTSSACARSALTCLFDTRSLGSQSRVIDRAPSGRDRANVAVSPQPAASSTVPPPMSSTSSGPASAPYQRRAAR
jgi:hypothetical protein